MSKPEDTEKDEQVVAENAAPLPDAVDAAAETAAAPPSTEEADEATVAARTTEDDAKASALPDAGGATATESTGPGGDPAGDSPRDAADAAAAVPAAEDLEEQGDPAAFAAAQEGDDAVAPASADATDAEVAEVADAPLAAEDEGAAAISAPVVQRRTRGTGAGSKPARSRQRPTGDLPVVTAQAKYVRTSARTARLVCDHIRGKSVDEAEAILAHTPRAVAEAWEKLLKSAVANAEHNHELVGDDLVIHQVFADEGPTLKRFRPRAMGRATPIRKRTSHLTIQLTPKEA